MWRTSFRRSITMAVTHRNRHFLSPKPRHTMFSAFTTSSKDESGEEKRLMASENGEAGISLGEVKKLMKLVNVEALKTKLGEEGREVIGYTELLKTCESMGVARSVDEAASFAKVLDDAGVVLLFRDKVYLHPDKVQKNEINCDWFLSISFLFYSIVGVFVILILCYCDSRRNLQFVPHMNNICLYV